MCVSWPPVAQWPMCFLSTIFQESNDLDSFMGGSKRQFTRIAMYLEAILTRSFLFYVLWIVTKKSKDSGWGHWVSQGFPSWIWCDFLPHLGAVEMGYTMVYPSNGSSNGKYNDEASNLWMPTIQTNPVMTNPICYKTGWVLRLKLLLPVKITKTKHQTRHVDDDDDDDDDESDPDRKQKTVII